MVYYLSKYRLVGKLSCVADPNLIFSPFNLFLTRNYMREIPVSLMESAKLDGANDGQVAFRIYFPLCKPILATVGLFYGIAYWNDWWNTIMLVTNKNMYTIQYYLMKLKSDLNFMRTLQGGGIGGGYPPLNRCRWQLLLSPLAH